MQKRMDWLIVLMFWGNHPILGAARVWSGVSRGQGLAVQINASLKCSSSASLQDMFGWTSCRTISQGAEKIKKKTQSGSSGTTFLPNPSPPWKSPWSRTRTWSTKRHLCLAESHPGQGAPRISCLVLTNAYSISQYLAVYNSCQKKTNKQKNERNPDFV